MTIANVEHRSNTSQNDEAGNYEDVRHLVDSWSATERARLAQYIITTLVAEEAQQPRKHNSVAAIFGRMAVADVPAPTDEEVTQMIEDYRMEKYG